MTFKAEIIYDKHFNNFDDYSEYYQRVRRLVEDLSMIAQEVHVGIETSIANDLSNPYIFTFVSVKHEIINIDNINQPCKIIEFKIIKLHEG
jgi:S-adenosylmethionine synthetase